MRQVNRAGEGYYIRDFMKNMMPDCMWLTAHDIYLMIEQSNEDIDLNVVTCSLTAYHRKGILTRKIDDYPAHKRRGFKPQYLYRRVWNSSLPCDTRHANSGRRDRYKPESSRSRRARA